jgi:hypothetical protein
MARIRRQILPHVIRLKVSGRLAAADVGRLERACAPALLTEDVSLEIDLSGVSESDELANLIVNRMAARGARIRRAIAGSVAGPDPMNR